MKKIALLLMTICILTSSCQKEFVSEIDVTEAIETIKVNVSNGKRAKGTLVLNYKLEIEKLNSRSSGVVTGQTDINEDGTFQLPYPSADIRNGLIIVTEKGQASYNLNDLENISINYDSLQQSFIGIIEWDEYLDHLRDGEPIDISPIYAGIQILSEEDDFMAALAAGADSASMTVDAKLQTTSGLLDLPNTGNVGSKIIVDNRPYRLLYESFLITHEKELKNICLHVRDSNGTDASFKLFNLPVCPGNVTLVTGVSLTEDVKFEIFINPAFDGEYNESH